MTDADAAVAPPPLMIELAPTQVHNVLLAADACGQTPQQFALEAIEVRVQEVLRICWFCRDGTAVMTLRNEHGAIGSCGDHLERMVEIQQEVAGQIGTWRRLHVQTHVQPYGDRGPDYATAELALRFIGMAADARREGDLDRAESYSVLAGRLTRRD